jgi:endoglucanase
MLWKFLRNREGKVMKKIGRVFLIMIITTLSTAMLFACSKENQIDKGNQGETEKKSETTEVPTKEPTKTASEEATNIDTDAATADAESAEDTETVEKVENPEVQTEEGQPKEVMQDIRDIPSVELVKEIKIGWNLGNTMDATAGIGVGSETSWGNPYTTKELIDAIKAAGFNTLRIPTTWEKHLGPAPDYIIDEAWLNRVKEIVDYGRSNDMFVIINMHHEEWHFPSYENEKAAIDILTKVWKQIAGRFENYDEYLIFEALNEPRQKGTNFEWNGGNEEGWDVINKFNAAFVETIRSAGGNNPLRHLMIPPYAASASTQAWRDFIVPEDDKIIVSIHAYTPYNFTLNKSGTAEWSSTNANDTKDIDSLMNNIYNSFISNGTPVILGEFGSMNKNDNVAARVDWAEYYISKATEKGIPCNWWDNGAFVGSGENFGLIDRYSLTWKYPEVVDALMRGLD